MIKPLQGLKAYRFTVGDTVQVLELPAECNVLAIYNDTDADPVYVGLNDMTLMVPPAADGTIRETPVILHKNESPLTVDFAIRRLAFIADAGKTVTVRVLALYQHGSV